MPKASVPMTAKFSLINAQKRRSVLYTKRRSRLAERTTPQIDEAREFQNLSVKHRTRNKAKVGKAAAGGRDVDGRG
jgi:hypothetical protein